MNELPFRPGLQYSPNRVKYNQYNQGADNARPDHNQRDDGRLGRSKAGDFRAAQDVAFRGYISSEEDARQGEAK